MTDIRGAGSMTGRESSVCRSPGRRQGPRDWGVGSWELGADSTGQRWMWDVEMDREGCGG